MFRMALVSAFSLLVACGDKNSPQATSLSPELAQGKVIVDANCRVCHAQGINGAPVIGNRKMWAPRLLQGKETLIQHAIDGYNYDMMPPRGGNPNLSDNDIRLAVTYLVSRVSE